MEFVPLGHARVCNIRHLGPPEGSASARQFSDASFLEIAIRIGSSLASSRN